MKFNFDDFFSWGGKYNTWRDRSGSLFGFGIGGPADEQLPPKPKTSVTGLGKTTDSTAFLSGMRQFSIFGTDQTQNGGS